LVVDVPPTGRAFLRLKEPAMVPPPGDPKASNDWDVAFEGWDVFTNGGASGGGVGGAVGPFDGVTYAEADAEKTPFVEKDKVAGPFANWFQYEQAPAHALWSRYHVFAVKDATRTWKVQVLSYYGQRDGAVVPGLYRIRYAELTPGGAGPTQEIVNLDGTGGGSHGGGAEDSECVHLGSGQRLFLSQTAAKQSKDWHLCVRRSNIQVNGEEGGPGGVTAVDLDTAKTPFEKLAELKARTADTERARFEAVQGADAAGRTFRGDRVMSFFGEVWYASPGAEGPAARKPAPGTWFVGSATGQEKYLIRFLAFDGATSAGPGRIRLGIKALKG
jgi:hypothetical protein